MTTSAWTWVPRALCTLLSAERLDEVPPPAGRRRRPFLAWLVEPETLPMDEETPGTGRKSALRTLWAPETLPLDQPPGPGPRRAAGRQGGGPAA